MMTDLIRKPAREIVFDTETTGIDPASGHRLVEIGLVEMIGRVETGRTWHAYFNPSRSMPPEAEAIHGLSEQFLADKPPFAELVGELLAFRSEEHTSELQSLMRISYAVFCLKQKNNKESQNNKHT